MKFETQLIFCKSLIITTLTFTLLHIDSLLLRLLIGTCIITGFYYLVYHFYYYCNHANYNFLKCNCQYDLCYLLYITMLQLFLHCTNIFTLYFKVLRSHNKARQASAFLMLSQSIFIKIAGSLCVTQPKKNTKHKNLALKVLTF